MTETRAILRPFDSRESMPLAMAAKRAGKSVDTLRRWCRRYGLGRQIASEWHISRIALMMFLNGDSVALRAYHEGDRSSELIAQYYRRENLIGVQAAMAAMACKQITQSPQTPHGDIELPASRK